MQLYKHSGSGPIILFSFIILAKGDNCNNSVAVKNDMSMNKYTYRLVDKSSLYECAAECMTSSACVSFNFDTRSRTCHLNSNSSDLVDVNPRPGFLFSDLKHWNYTLTSPCSTVPCSASSKCRTFRNGEDRCFGKDTEFQGCGTPSAVSDADVTYSGHFLHAEANYTCKKDFRSCTSQTGSVCQASGKWTVVQQFCERFRWLDPDTISQNGIFEANLPCKEKHNHVIQIKAIPTKKTMMTFNVLRGADKLLLIHCRFHWRKSIKSVVLNTHLHGYWGREYRPKQFPFTVGEPFTLRIELRNGMYKVSVDGSQFKPFNERQPGAQPDRIQIADAVRVESVEIII